MRVLLAAVVLAGAVYLAYFLTHRSSPLHAPETLGSMVLLAKNPPELERERSQLGSRGLHDVVLAEYGPAGSSPSSTATGFVLAAGRLDHAQPIGAELQQAMQIASTLTGGRIRPFSERLANSDYTCGTFSSPRGQATTCFWQSSKGIVVGVGYRIDGTTTISLTASAKVHLGLAG
jgi:hypothetical protein